MVGRPYWDSVADLWRNQTSKMTKMGENPKWPISVVFLQHTAARETSKHSAVVPRDSRGCWETNLTTVEVFRDLSRCCFSQKYDRNLKFDILLLFHHFGGLTWVTSLRLDTDRPPFMTGHKTELTEADSSARDL